MTMRLARDSQSTEISFKSYIESGITSSSPQEDLLRHIDQLGVEWYLTEEGTLWIKYWQIAADDFAPTEQIAQLRQGGQELSEADAMDWMSKHLPELKERYAGKWIAIVDCQVMADSEDISDLIDQVRTRQIENPFITQIPAEPIVWNTAYAQ